MFQHNHIFQQLHYYSYCDIKPWESNKTKKKLPITTNQKPLINRIQVQ